MNKNKKIMLVLLLAILVAVLGGAAAYMYLVPQKTTVYVFKDNYKAGTKLTSSMLTAVQTDSKIVVAGADADTSSKFVTGDDTDGDGTADIDEVLKIGDTLRMDVSSGMPLIKSLLTVSGGSNVEKNMDPSKIAVTVSVDNNSGVTKDLKQGSRVNVYVSTGQDDTQKTTLLFQGVRVLKTSSSDGTLQSATLEVNKDESLKLINAASSGTIYFGLIDSSGYEYVKGTPSYTSTAS